MSFTGKGLEPVRTEMKIFGGEGRKLRKKFYLLSEVIVRSNAKKLLYKRYSSSTDLGGNASSKSLQKVG